MKNVLLRLKPKNREEIFLFLLCGFHLLSNLVWLTLNTAPLPWDQAGHTLIALHHSYFFNSITSQNPFSFLTISPYYPPFVHILAGIPILFFGHPVFIPSLLITFFLITSIFLLYVYIKDTFNNPTLAFLTATIYSFSPIIFEHSRWLLLEIPLLSAFLAALICLERWKKHNKIAYWYGFIVAVAIALLIKWLAAIYLFPLIVLFTFRTFKKIRTREISLHSLAIGITIFLLLILPWYASNLQFILRETQNTILPESSDPQSLWSVSNFFFYFYQFITFQGTIFFAILALIGAELLADSKHRQRFLVFFYILFIYIVFTIIPNKDPRYTMPIVLFTSTLIAYVFTWLTSKNRFLGFFLTALFLGYIITLYSLLSFRPQTFHYQRAIQLPILGWIDYINLNDNSAHAYNTDVWPQTAIHETIEADAKGKEVKVLNLVDQERFNLGNLLLARETGKFWNVLSLPAPASIIKTEENAKSFMKNYHYVLIAEKNIGVSATRNKDVLDFLTNFVKIHNIDWFQKLDSFKTPDNDTITIYTINL